MSGLRDELAALADEWERTGREYAARADHACGANCGVCVVLTDASRLRMLLDRFPPEAEGEARRIGSLTADDLGAYITFWDAHEGEPRFGVLKNAHHNTAIGSASTWVRIAPFDAPFMMPSDALVEVQAALAASPEEQDQ